MDSIQTIIKKERKYLLRRTYCDAVLFSVILSLIPILCVAFIDYFFPFYEQLATIILWVAIVISGCLTGKYLYQKLKQVPDEKTIALMIEESCPEFMDSLICSTELLSRSNDRLSQVSKLLVDNVSRTLDKDAIHLVIKGKATGSLKQCAFAILSIALCILALSMPILGKAYLSITDMLRGSSSGITVAPGDAEVAIGDDVKIEAIINRGMPKPIITMIIGSEVYRYDMYGEKDRKFSFEVFGVGEPFSYYVSTPSLKSQTFHVTTYDKPEILSSRISVIPPKYTALASQSYDELKDISVPIGSEVTLNITSSSPGSASLLIENRKSVDLQKIQPTSHQIALTIFEDISYKISLIDLEGHAARTNDVYHIESVADFSPIIQILAPKENEVIRENSTVSFLFKINDDYSIESVKLHLFISGEENQIIELLKTSSSDSEAIKEKVIAHSINLKNRVKNGDVISYYCSAFDNSQPITNNSRSAVQFIEIRPEKPDTENNQNGNSGNTKTLNVSDLIVEQKRIIRTTLDENQKNDQAGGDNDAVDDLIKASSELYLTTKNRYNELKGGKEPELPQTEPKDLAEKMFNDAIGNAVPDSPQPLELGKIGDLFEETILNMGKAKDILVKRLLFESLTYQQLSLSKLISIEIELDKNPPPSGSSGEGEESKEEQEVSETNKKKSRQQQSMKLDKIVQDLDRLINKQGKLNDEINRKHVNKKGLEKFIEFLSEEESDIIKRAGDVKGDLKNVAMGGAAVNELNKAIRHMNDALGKIERKQFDNAEKYGQYSKQFLERTKEIAAGLQDEMVNNQLKAAAAALKNILENQSDLMQKTQNSQQQGNIDSVKSNLIADQKQNRLNFEKFLNQISRLSSEMESVNSKASYGLEETLNAAFKRNVSGKMKRVENAIRYKQLDKALDYQKQSHETLRELYEGLEGVIQENFSLSHEEVAKMLDKVLKNIKKVKQAGGQDKSKGDKQDLYQDAAKDLDEISDKLGSQIMDDIVRSMQQNVLGQSSAGFHSDEKLLALLYKAAGLLEAKLLKEALKEKVNLTRISDEEPLDEYKKLVNEYFKNLSKTF